AQRSPAAGARGALRRGQSQGSRRHEGREGRRFGSGDLYGGASGGSRRTSEALARANSNDAEVKMQALIRRMARVGGLVLLGVAATTWAQDSVRVRGTL